MLATVHTDTLRVGGNVLAEMGGETSAGGNCPGDVRWE